MEADFQREYGVDLSARHTLERMSWRRFLVLVGGLGPNSATTTMLMGRRHAQPGRARGATVVRGKEAAAAALAAIFGPPKPPGGDS